MLEFYAALRAMLYPTGGAHRAGKACLPAPLHSRELADALCTFERRNRGHHRLLGDLQLSQALPVQERAVPDAETRTRRATVAQSTHALFDAVMSAPELAARPTYDNPALDAVMHASDHLGWFNDCARHKLLALENHVQARMAEKLSAFRVDVRLELHEKGFEPDGITQPCLRLTTRLDRMHWAKRTIVLPYLYCASLRDARYLLDGVMRDIDKLVDEVLTWPECVDHADVQARHDKIKQDLANMASGYSPEELEYLNANWRTVHPKSTIRRWLARCDFASLEAAPGMVRSVQVTLTETEPAFVDESEPVVLSATHGAAPELEQLLMAMTNGSVWLRRESRGTAELQSSDLVTRPGTVVLSHAMNRKRLPSQWYSLTVSDPAWGEDAEPLELCVHSLSRAQSLFRLLANEQLVLEASPRVSPT